VPRLWVKNVVGGLKRYVKKIPAKIDKAALPM